MLENKIIVLTGAHGGIGSHIHSELLRVGAKVIGLERSPQANSLAVDLTDLHATQNAIAEVLEKHGRLDGVIHTAGGFAMHGFLESSPEVLEQMMQVNFQTAAHLAVAAMPALLASSGFFGAIAAAQVVRGGAAKTAAYSASKAAMVYYIKSLALEFKAVRFGIVYPMGTVDTPSNRQSMPTADINGWIDPRAIAEAFVFMASRSNRGHVQELQIWGA